MVNPMKKKEARRLEPTPTRHKSWIQMAGEEKT